MHDHLLANGLSSKLNPIRLALLALKHLTMDAITEPIRPTKTVKFALAIAISTEIEPVAIINCLVKQMSDGHFIEKVKAMSILEPELVALKVKP